MVSFVYPAKDTPSITPVTHNFVDLRSTYTTRRDVPDYEEDAVLLDVQIKMTDGGKAHFRESVSITNRDSTTR